MNTSLKPPTNIANELASVTELFHRVNSVIPDEQKLVTVKPEMAAADALELLEKHGFSQVPVVVGQEVLGLFSYRDFSRRVIEDGREAAEKNRKFEPLSLTVGRDKGDILLFQKSRMSPYSHPWKTGCAHHRDTTTVGSTKCRVTFSARAAKKLRRGALT